MHLSPGTLLYLPFFLPEATSVGCEFTADKPVGLYVVEWGEFWKVKAGRKDFAFRGPGSGQTRGMFTKAIAPGAHYFVIRNEGSDEVLITVTPIGIRYRIDDHGGGLTGETVVHHFETLTR